MNSENTREMLIGCLTAFLELDAPPSFANASWVEDVGLDSLGLFHFLLSIEKSFSIEFSDDEMDLGRIERFDELVAMVNAHRIDSSVDPAQSM